MNQTYNNVTRQCKVQENVHTPPPPRGVIGEFKGGGGFKRENSLQIELKLESPKGLGKGWVGVGQSNQPSVARIWIFFGITGGFVTLRTSNSPCDST